MYVALFPGSTAQKCWAVEPGNEASWYLDEALVEPSGFEKKIHIHR